MDTAKMKGEIMQETTDIFLWANNVDAQKRELNVEFFLFNKNYTPYTVRIGSMAYDSLINSLFLDDILNGVSVGAGEGMTVRDITYAGEDKNFLPRVDLEKVGRAETLLHLIENELHDMLEFNDEEHDFKRIKGLVAQFSFPDDTSKKFYIVKQIQQTSVLKGLSTWQFKEGRFDSFDDSVVFKIPTDNHVLIVGGDIFVFNKSKFESLFQYDARKAAIVEAKGKEIESTYKLSYNTIGLDLAAQVLRSKKLMNKMVEVQTGLLSQMDVLTVIDDQAIELMTDDNGSIILMDDADIMQFLTIINDDYVKSVVSKSKYISKKKNLVES